MQASQGVSTRDILKTNKQTNKKDMLSAFFFGLLRYQILADIFNKVSVDTADGTLNSYMPMF